MNGRPPDHQEALMTNPNASRNGGESAITLTFEPWMLAEIRRQLYIDLTDCAEHLAKEANSASQMTSDDVGAKVIGEDVRNYVHKTIADAAALLDAIGWDVDGDTALLWEHSRHIDCAKGLR